MLWQGSAMEPTAFQVGHDRDRSRLNSPVVEADDSAAALGNGSRISLTGTRRDPASDSDIWQSVGVRAQCPPSPGIVLTWRAVASIEVRRKLPRVLEDVAKSTCCVEFLC